MFGMFSLADIQSKIQELREKVLAHQETFHSAGTTVVVAASQILSLELSDLTTSEHIRDTINTAFENHAQSTVKIAQDFIEEQPKNIRIVLEQAMKQQ